MCILLAFFGNPSICCPLQELCPCTYCTHQRKELANGSTVESPLYDLSPSFRLLRKNFFSNKHKDSHPTLFIQHFCNFSIAKKKASAYILSRSIRRKRRISKERSMATIMTTKSPKRKMYSAMVSYFRDYSF